MIDKTIVILRGGDTNTFLKVPGLFCLYFDKDKLRKTDIVSNDIPLFIEIEYDEKEISNEKYFFHSYSFDPQKEKGKLQVDSSNKSKVPNEILKCDFLKKKRNEIMMLLSVFTNKFIFHYPQIQGWFLELTLKLDEKLESKYGSLNYLHTFSKEENLEKLYSIKYEQQFGNPTVLHVRDVETGILEQNISISDMFHYYYNCPKEVMEAVRNATRLFYQSQNHINVDLTTEFVYLVIALESLIEIEYKGQKKSKCGECGQPIYSVSKKFHAFLEKYYDGYDKKEINEIYKLRSSIVHRGVNIVNSSFFLFDDSLEEKEIFYKNQVLIEKTRYITRSVINKFLYYNKEKLPV